MIRHALIAATLLIATPVSAQSAPDRYQLNLSIHQAGVEVVSTQTHIMEDAPASASANIDGVAYEAEASLFTVQGDGDAAEMLVEAHLSRGGEQIAAPRLTFIRGNEAKVEVGDESGDVMRMTITPLP